MLPVNRRIIHIKLSDEEILSKTENLIQNREYFLIKSLTSIKTDKKDEVERAFQNKSERERNK